MENIKEINLAEILSALLRKAWLIVLCAVLGGGAAFTYTEYFVTPLYRSSVSIYVNNTKASINSSAMGISASDLATSQRLVNTYINILKSDTVLEKVAETADLGVSAAGIRYMMSAAAMGETEVFEVFISNADPYAAAKIANAIAEVAPDEIAYFVEGSSTKIVDYAKPAYAPYTPNKATNTMYGMVIGVFLAACVIILQTLLDVRIKGEEDLAIISNAPVLGLIPDLALEIKGDYGYNGYRSGYKVYKGYSADPESISGKEDRA